MSVVTESTYTLADLKNWPAGVGNWPSDGTALAVIGHPIAHSLSPVMHNAALADLAISKPEFKKWRYFKFDIAPQELKEALVFFHKNGFRGLNLTVPHKALVLDHLDLGLQHQLVKDIGAANTLKYNDTGWYSRNTDNAGLSAALLEDLDVDLKGANVILLGAGGASAAAIRCLLSRCASLWIGNRTASTLNTLLVHLKKSHAYFGALGEDASLHLEGFDPKNPPKNLPTDSIIINATSLGLKVSDESPIDLGKISASGKSFKVFDMIYRPQQTELLKQAQERGIQNANGLSMLVHQGAASLEWWIKETAPNARAPVEIMQRAVRNALN